MSRTSPNKFQQKLDLSPEKLNIAKIPQINMNFEITQLLSDRENNMGGGGELAEKGSVSTL
jgi:hypothetical protein